MVYVILSSPQVELGVHLIVYMRTNPDVALSRLKQRGRGEEHLIDRQYIKDLHQLHEDWLVKCKNVRPASAIIVDADRDLEDIKEILSKQAEMLLEDAKKEKNESEYNRVLLDKVPKLKQQILKV